MKNEYGHVVVGQEVGILSGTGIKKKIYCVAKVERLTPTRIVVDRRQFYKLDGREVNGLSYLELMTAAQIKAWRKAKTKEEAVAEERKRNYDPRKDDDHTQSALRSLRDKARGLCEKLQDEANSIIDRDPNAKPPCWWADYLQVLLQIEESEHALASFGKFTTLKSHAEVADWTFGQPSSLTR
jgi:hypothetical protein